MPNNYIDDNYISQRVMGHQRLRKDLRYKKGYLMKQSKLFPCYSIPLRDYFTSKGIRYELVGLHPKSHDMFWVYIKTIELEKAMQEWSLKL